MLTQVYIDAQAIYFIKMVKMSSLLAWYHYHYFVEVMALNKINIHLW